MDIRPIYKLHKNTTMPTVTQAGLSIGTERKTITRPLTEEQITSLNERITEATIEFMEVDKERKEITRGYKDRLKNIQVNIAEMAEQRRTRVLTVTEDCHKVPDYDKGVMEYYDAEGALVDVRKLRPDERTEPLNY